MQKISLLRITVVALISILALSVSPANADRNKLITVSGVVIPVFDPNNPGDPDPELGIPFPPDPKFSVVLEEPGRFIITIYKRVDCLFDGDRFPGDFQAAVGARLANPYNDTRAEAGGSNYYLSSPLVFVETVKTGICNDKALYQFTTRNRSDDELVNGPFGFQITGSKIRKRSHGHRH